MLLRLWLMPFILSATYLCAESVELKSNLIISEIIGTDYYLSHEEKVGDGKEVYRPAGFLFPPSHPRPGFRFDTEGNYVFLEPGANDGPHVEVLGRWQRVDDKIRIYRDNEIVEEVKLTGTKNRIIKEIDCGCGG